jgi:hypothetical protein
MRNLVIAARRAVALATVLVVLAMPAAYADEGNPYEPPGARIKPPIGADAQEEPSVFELFVDWLCMYSRINPIG